MKRVSIDVGPDRVYAVITSGARIVWRASTPIAVRETLADAIERMLSPAPLSRRSRRRSRVRAAVGPSWLQTKPLAGLPKVRRRRFLSRLVRENVESFFLRGRGPIVLGEIDTRRDGTTWAAGFDETVLHEIADGVRRSGFRLGDAIPAVSAVATLVSDGSFTWSDGGAHVVVVTKHAAIEGIRRIPPAGLVLERPALPAPLAALGEYGWGYAAAYGAARAPRRASFAWRPEPDSRRVRLVKRARNLITASAIIGAAAVALLAPGLRATRFVARSSVELSTLRDIQTEMARTEGELRRVSARIDGVSRFRAERGGITLILAGLAQALPESTAIVSFRVDSLEGSFVAVATHAADVLPQLVAVDRIVAPRIVGSVTTESVNAAHLERATFRFRRRAYFADRPSPATRRAPAGVQ